MRRIFLFVWAMAPFHHPLLSIAGVQKNSTPLVRAGNFLFAPVSINHAAPTWWLLDTGAPSSEVDIEAAKALRLLHGPDREGDPANDIIAQHKLIIQVSSLEVGSFSTGGAKLTAKSLSELNHGSLPSGWSGDFNRNGMIGMDILLRQNAIVDWSNQQIILAPVADPARTRAAYEQEGFTYIPLSVTPENHLEVIGRVGNSEYRFYIDTGDPKTLIRQSVVEAENLPSRLPKPKYTAPCTISKTRGYIPLPQKACSLATLISADTKCVAPVLSCPTPKEDRPGRDLLEQIFSGLMTPFLT